MTGIYWDIFGNFKKVSINRPQTAYELDPLITKSDAFVKKFW